MKNNIHHEFVYQSRELGAQIDDTLGDPPDRKNYTRVIKSLLGEFTRGTEIDDVNLLSFALSDYLSFDNPAGLLAQSKHYDKGDAAKTMAMVSCTDAVAGKALAVVFGKNPELARKAIITAFLFKNTKHWADIEEPDMQEEEENNMDDGDELDVPSQDVIDLFDSRGDGND